MIKHKKGFSLIELLIAASISCILVIIIFSMMSFQQKNQRTQEQLYDMVQDYRWMMDSLGLNIRQAGYGVPDTSFNLWMPWATGMTSSIMITEGGLQPDSITLAGSFSKPYPFDSSAPRLTADAPAGSNSLTVNSSSFFNTTNKSLIFIGGLENAIVTAVSGNTLTIDANPYIIGNQGIQFSYKANAQVDVITKIQFYISSNKLINADISGSQDIISEEVEDLQFTSSGNIISFTVRLKSKSEDPAYHNSTYNDKYRRVSQKTSVISRNNLIK